MIAAKLIEKGRAARIALWRLVGHLLSSLTKYPVVRHNESDKTDELEAYAKERGMTVVSCDDESWDDSLAARVIYPLAHAKQKQTNGKQERIFLTDDFWVKCERGDDAGSSNNGESVPPVFYLQPGERITHVCVDLPNSVIRPYSTALLGRGA